MKTLLCIILLSLICLKTQVYGQCSLANVPELVPIITPPNGEWVSLNSLDVNINKSDVVILGMQACSGVHVLLQEQADNTRSHIYEVIIGDNDNTVSGLRECPGCRLVEWKRHQILNCRYFKYIWISWCGRHILVGEGYEPGRNGFLVYKRHRRRPIMDVSIKTDTETHWAIS